MFSFHFTEMVTIVQTALPVDRRPKDKHPQVTHASVTSTTDLGSRSQAQLPVSPSSSAWLSYGGCSLCAPPSARAACSALFPSCPAQAAAVPQAAAPPRSRSPEHRRAPPPAQAAGPHIRVPTPAAQTLALWSWRRGRQC